MLKWQRIDKSFFINHRWVLFLWMLFIMFSLAYIAATPYGSLNILISEHYNSDLGFFFRYYTYFGEEWLLVPVGLILIVLIQKWDFVIRLTATFLLNTLITVPIKFLIFETERPKLALQKFQLVFTEGVEVHQYNSFPSGHSSAAFAMALAVAFWFNDKAISIVVILMAICVGLSRIYLQQHFVEDVMGGSVIGLIAATFASGFYYKSAKQ